MIALKRTGNLDLHRIDNSRFLLYIEPSSIQKSEHPIDDEIVKIVTDCFNKAKIGTADYSNLESNGSFTECDGWRGRHTTDCGERSECHDYLLGNGMITNSLCVFYLRYYRDAIPGSEMQKVIDLIEHENGNVMGGLNKPQKIKML